MEKEFKTKNSYVQSVNDYNDNEIDNVEQYCNKRLTPLFLSSVFFFTFGIVTFSSMLGLGLASLALGGLTTIAHNHFKNKKKNETYNLIKEMDHANKYLNISIPDDDKHNIGRKKRIKELKNDKKAMKANEEKYNASSKVYGAATVVGAGLSLINPLFAIIPAVSLIGTGIINKNRNKNYKDLTFTERRINNLENDIELVKCQRIEAKESKKEDEKEPTRRHEDEVNEKTYSSSLYPHHPMGPGFGPHGGHGFGGPGFGPNGGPGFGGPGGPGGGPAGGSGGPHALADTSDEELVSNYVENLARENEDSSSYQKIKM